ncbi:MAG: transporter substrate-binding domain-containing protein [Desulfamplus sp.]|nr:transporter substrate-binding domain-containing protein [Desulfamplus sp.]
MKNSISKQLIIVFVFIAMLFIAIPIPCHAGQNITVGVYNFSPLVFTDDTGKAQGFFPDILDYIAKKEGWEIKYIPGSWSECLTRIQNGEIDLQVCIASSEERSKLLDFSDYLILDWASVFKKKGSQIQTIFDLNDKRVSVVKSGITTDEFKKVIQQFGIPCQIIEKNENTENLKAVHDGEADAGICPNIYGTMLQNDYKIERTSIVFSPIKLRFATKKEMNQNIISVLNKHISELKADRGSIYYNLLNKWTGSYEKKILPQWVLITLGIFISASIALFLFNMILKKRVKSKTEELVVANIELKFSEERLALVLEGSQLGYWDWDIITGHVQRNSRWAEMLGYTLDEIILNVKQWTDLHHPDDRKSAWQSINDHLEGRTEIHKTEYRMLAKDGQYKWILDCAKIVRRDEEGRPIRMSGTHTDITERKQTEEEQKKLQAQLSHAQKMESVGRLAGGVAHDFNNMLGVILGHTEMLLYQIAPDHPFYEDLQKIQSAG